MMVMPSNNAKMVVGYLAGRYPGRIGWLIGADGWKQPHDWLPYAIDNGAYPAFCKGEPWNEHAFYDLLKRTKGQSQKPLWVAVPDVVANRDATLRSWEIHSPRVAVFKTHLAFVVQDGMTPEDVPAEADLVFVGGTTKWKWQTLPLWTASFPRVHVGRVNTERMLWMAHECGAESCDGTGWFRGCKRQLQGLINYLDHSTNGRPQMEFSLSEPQPPGAAAEPQKRP